MKPETPAPATGNVIVNYVDEAGNKLQTSVNDEKDAPVGKEYNTTDYKPTEIVSNGKVYELVPTKTADKAGDTFTVKNGNPAETGTVTEGTKDVTYVYRLKPETPAKEGKVVVNYEDENGTPLKDPVEDTPNSPVGTPYNTADDNRPSTITKDGKTYELVPSKTKGPENGTVTEGTTTVTYVYREVVTPTPDPVKEGKVVVNYEDENGTPLKAPVEDTPNSPVGTPYNTADDNRPSTITKDGKTYELVPSKTKGPENGTVTEGTTTVTYVYREVIPVAKEGNVIVHYKDTDGNTISADVVDQPTTKVGTGYDTTDNKPNEITVGEAKYVLVPSKTVGNETGTVVEGTTEITYVYQKVANWIPLIPGESNPPKTEYPFDPTNPDKEIDRIPTNPKTDVPTVPYVPGYTPKDPGGNPLTPVDPNDPSKGYVPPTPENPGKDTFIPYTPNPEEPKKYGNVIVHYEDEEGNVVKKSVVDTTNALVGTTYSTTDRKDETIKVGDNNYVLVPSKTRGTEEGKVVEGTTEITYVYKKIGNWIPLIPGEPNPPKNPYPFDPNNPNDPVPPTPEVPGKPGVPVVPYVPGYTPKDPGGNPLVPVDPKDPNKGYIPPVPENPGKDTPIPYTPDPVKEGKVIVNYVDENGTPLKDPVEDMPNSPVDTPYTTEDRRIPEIVTEDGTRYVRVPNLTEGNENGKIVEGTTTVTYVYKKIGNWIPLIPGEPNPPKNPYPFDPNNPNDPVPPTPEVPGKPGVPVVPYVPGYTPKDPGGNPLVPVDPKDPNKGYIPPVPENPGKDTPIPYTPDPVKEGKVIVNYVDENGTPLKDPVEDMPNSPVDTPYTTEDRRIPEIVTEDGTRYVRVPNLTEGNENGKIVEGTTTVTYVYKKIGNWIPLIPGEPNPPKNPYPFDPNNPNDPVPPTPEVPGKPGVPVVPYVPGYTPKDPGGNPLVPVDPNDPSKGYIPPVPENPGEDTPIPYTPNPTPEPTPTPDPAPKPKPNPGQPVPPTPEKPVTPSTPAPVADKAAVLPNTGEESSSATVMGAALLVAALGFGTARRRKED